MGRRLSPGAFNTLVGVPVLIALRLAGMAGDVPLIVLVVLTAATCLSNDLPGIAERRGWRQPGWQPLSLLPMALCGVVVIATGWLALLPGANTGTIAATIRREGPRSWRPLAIVSGVETLLGVVLVAVAGFPSQVAVPQVYGLVGSLAVLQLMFGHNLVAMARQAELSGEESRRNERRFRKLVQQSFDVILVTDRNAVVTYVSPAIEEVAGYRPSEVLGQPGWSFVHPDDLGSSTEAMVGSLANPESTFVHECRIRRRDGSFAWFEVNIRNLLDDPDIGGLVINQRDVTERRQSEQRLAYEASHDSLTGLPNRATFLSQASRACRDAGGAEIGFGVLFLDLDGFKAVNDTLGHGVGDKVLCALAGRLRGAVPEASCIARLAGDEFTVLIEGVGHPDELQATADRITAALTDPLTVDQHRILIGASVGLAWSGEHSTPDPELLLQIADADMYEAKRTTDREAVIV